MVRRAARRRDEHAQTVRTSRDASNVGWRAPRRRGFVSFFVKNPIGVPSPRVSRRRNCRGDLKNAARAFGGRRTRTRGRARGCARAARARRARRARRPRPGLHTRGPARRGRRRGQTARRQAGEDGERRRRKRGEARTGGFSRASTHLRVGIVPRREHIRGHVEKRAARRGVGHRESDALRSARGVAFFGRHG